MSKSKEYYDNAEKKESKLLINHHESQDPGGCQRGIKY